LADLHAEQAGGKAGLAGEIGVDQNGDEFPVDPRDEGRVAVDGIQRFDAAGVMGGTDEGEDQAVRVGGALGRGSLLAGPWALKEGEALEEGGREGEEAADSAAG
jgi:hypothetical protein